MQEKARCSTSEVMWLGLDRKGWRVSFIPWVWCPPHLCFKPPLPFPQMSHFGQSLFNTCSQFFSVMCGPGKSLDSSLFLKKISFLVFPLQKEPLLRNNWVSSMKCSNVPEDVQRAIKMKTWIFFELSFLWKGCHFSFDISDQKKPISWIDQAQ